MSEYDHPRMRCDDCELPRAICDCEERVAVDHEDEHEDA